MNLYVIIAKSNTNLVLDYGNIKKCSEDLGGSSYIIENHQTQVQNDSNTIIEVINDTIQK